MLSIAYLKAKISKNVIVSTKGTPPTKSPLYRVKGFVILKLKEPLQFNLNFVVMQTYLLAANLFALTALLLGLYDFSKGRHSWRLIPLFLLVISRSVSLIVALKTGADQPAYLATLEVFSALCLVWALMNPLNLPPLWQRLAWLGGGISLFLVLMPAFADWPAPYPLHSLIIAMFGAPLILVSLGQLSWIHLASPLLLAAANFFGLLELTNLAQLITLLAYVALIGALHLEGLQTYKGRQQASQAMAADAIYLNQARQRLLEVSEIISAVPGLAQSMEHVARSMAHITHSDQSVILMQEVGPKTKLRAAAIYSPERPVELDEYQNNPVDLSGCPPLQNAIEQQTQQILYPRPDDGNSLSSVYALWDEYRLGPTLIQPLMAQGRPIGVLILGNPVTQRPIQDDDQLLCQSLSTQIAMMVESYRQYFDLQRQITSPAPMQPFYAPPLMEQTVAEPVKIAETTAANRLPAKAALPVSLSGATSPLVEKETKLGNYLAIVEAVQQGIVVSNAQGRVQLVNQAAERILGKTRRELLQQPIGAIYGQIDSGESIEELAAAFSRRNEPLPTFFENEERAIQGYLIPWRSANREWLGIIAVFNDVTRQVKADRARNDFITALSRTLRGPLTLIKGYAELIINGALGDYSADQLQVLRVIHSSAERVVHVLDNALQVSLQNKRQIVPKYEKVDVIGVISAAVHEVAPMAKLRNIKLVKEIKSELPHIIADRKHLHTILENLLSNACRFTPPGGRVTLQAWVQQERDGNIKRPYLQLAVIDTGAGIPRPEQRRIFDPFYQLETPDSRVAEGGLGMGLAVVKELVELHNGRVWVESTPGSGSVFQVSLPVSQE